MNHLNKETLEDVCNRLWDVSGSLKGLSCLFTQGTRGFCPNDDEFFGLGQLIKGLSNEISCIEDILKRSDESRTGVELKGNKDEPGLR